MNYLWFFVAILIGAVVAFEAYRATIRSRKTAEINDWLADRLLHHPPRALPPDHVDVVKNTMDDDFDLWRELSLNRSSKERKEYHQQVVNFGRYLSVFEFIDDCNPSLYYGVFYDEDESQFRVWIEFRYQSDAVWVLTENDDGGLSIFYFSEFRINHPGLVLRHPLTFAYDE